MVAVVAPTPGHRGEPASILEKAPYHVPLIRLPRAHTTRPLLAFAGDGGAVEGQQSPWSPMLIGGGACL